MLKGKKLEHLNQDELIQTVRHLLAEADALSSRIAAVNEIGVAINETLDFKMILKVVAKQAKWLLDYQHLSVCLRQDHQWTLMPLFGTTETMVNTDWEATQNVGNAIRTGQAQLIRNGIDSPFLASYKSQIIIPLISGKERLGTINFATLDAEHYTQEDMRIGYMLALQISAALRNANVFKELQATQAELRLHIEDLDAYNHTIAHDLKSPLSSITLASELVAMSLPENTPARTRDFVENIKLSAFQMNRMIDQLLMLAKLRHLGDDLQPVDVKHTVQEALFRFSHLTDEQHIKITLADDLPSALGQTQWIEEIFANLISNAIKYMGEDNLNPSITIRAKAEGEMVRYEVCDTGIGIKPEDKDRLFEMFARVGGTKAEGLGLGLSIVRRIVLRLKGQVGIESTFGVGSSRVDLQACKLEYSIVSPK